MTAERSELRDEDRTRCEIWTRVMGYYRPIAYFNPGKQQEFKDRTCFKLDSDLRR